MGIKRGDVVFKLDENGKLIFKEMTVDELRARNSVSLKAKKQNEINTALKLHEKGMSNTAIAEKMFGDKSKESTVRNLLAPNAMEKATAIDNTTKMLKDMVDQKQFIDVGKSAELLAGITRTMLNTAVAALEDQGYKMHYIAAKQVHLPIDFVKRMGEAYGYTFEIEHEYDRLCLVNDAKSEDCICRYTSKKRRLCKCAFKLLL